MGMSKRTDSEELSRLGLTMEAAEKSLKNLSNKVRVLPKVGKDGSSECPFAEKLYDQKDQAIKAAEKLVRELRDLLKPLDEKISRCKGNLARVSSDMGAIQSDEAKSEYQSAKRAQEFQYRRVIEQKKALLELLNKAEQMLKKARAKKYPAEKSKKSSSPSADVLLEAVKSPFSPAAPFLGSLPRLPNPLLKTEIPDLVSLGPLTRRPD